MHDIIDIIDIEFLGNVYCQPYILPTNIYKMVQVRGSKNSINGSGNSEQEFYL